jgi:hypothetical protein
MFGQKLQNRQKRRSEVHGGYTDSNQSGASQRERDTRKPSKEFSAIKEGEVTCFLKYSKRACEVENLARLIARSTTSERVSFAHSASSIAAR